MSIMKIGATELYTIKTNEDLPQALKEFGLDLPRPTLVLVGGAGGMSDELIAQTRMFFEQQIAPFVSQNNLTVVDGGTKSGIMLAMGGARANLGANFPLVGVTVQKIIRQDPTMLEENHTHLILTPGEDWGDEVPFLSQVATHLAGPYPSMTLLFNGGQITWKDASASVEQKRMVLVAEGSGRAADGISQTQTGALIDMRALELIKTGLIRVANPYTKPQQFMNYLRQTFNVQE